MYYIPLFLYMDVLILRSPRMGESNLYMDVLILRSEVRGCSNAVSAWTRRSGPRMGESNFVHELIRAIT